MQDIIIRIMAFCDAHFMEPTQFGIKAVNDGNFVTDLRHGRKPYRRTIKRILDFMAKEDAKKSRKNGRVK